MFTIIDKCHTILTLSMSTGVSVSTLTTACQTDKLGKIVNVSTGCPRCLMDGANYLVFELRTLPIIKTLLLSLSLLCIRERKRMTIVA